MRSIKILGFYLSYPSADHKNHWPECRALLGEEGKLDSATLHGIDSFGKLVEQTELLDLQEAYVALFDRTPSLSLHLFEHVHGDSRERGAALVDLLRMYEEAGLRLDALETPDYLPMFCEYLSTLTAGKAASMLASIVDILSLLALRLENRNSAYAALFRALVFMAARKPDAKVISDHLRQSAGGSLDAYQLDAQWVEQFAFEKMTQQPDGSCPKAEEMLARIATSRNARSPR